MSSRGEWCPWVEATDYRKGVRDRDVVRSATWALTTIRLGSGKILVERIKAYDNTQTRTKQITKEQIYKS
jgi:hypothetical protein